MKRIREKAEPEVVCAGNPTRVDVFFSHCSTKLVPRRSSMAVITHAEVNFLVRSVISLPSLMLSCQKVLSHEKKMLGLQKHDAE
jgi:hypothetical protein